MCAELYIYKTQLDPIGLPGETFHLIRASGELDVEIVAAGAMPEYIHNFGAIGAGAWLRDQEDTNLELNDGEFGQFRMRVLDDVQLYLKNPGPTQQWRSARTNFYLPIWPTDPQDFMREFFFKASEFFDFEDETPRFDLYATLAAATSRVAFSGFRFRYKKLGLDAKGVQISGKVTLWINSWPTGSI